MRTPVNLFSNSGSSNRTLFNDLFFFGAHVLFRLCRCDHSWRLGSLIRDLLVLKLIHIKDHVLYHISRQILSHIGLNSISIDFEIEAGFINITRKFNSSILHDRPYLVFIFLLRHH